MVRKVRQITARGGSQMPYPGFISAAITKPTNATATTEQFTALYAKRRPT